MDLLDEVAEHLLGLIVIGDDAVFEGAYSDDIAGRAAQHPFRFLAYGQNLLIVSIDRDDARLPQQDAFAANVNERIRRAEVDPHVPGKTPENASENPHLSR
jgi:hypothetical protein